MSDDQLNVPSVQAPTVYANRIPSIGTVRNNVSRTQLTSSDVIRAPRRPAMMLQPIAQESANEHEQNDDMHVQKGTDNRSGLDLQHRRVSNTLGERVHVQRGSVSDLQERRVSNARRGSVHGQSESNNQPEPDMQNRRLSSDARGEHHEFTQHASHDLRENMHANRVHRQPDSTPQHRVESETVRNLHPDDDMAHRRRYFQGVSSARTRGSAITEDLDDKDDRYVVPALPMPVAIVCCVLNFILPGFGSMTAALCVFCCAQTEDMTWREKCGSCCTVFGIGVLQLLLVACFLIGWIWSCIWGITFIGMSASYYDVDDWSDDEYYYADTNNRARERTVRGRTPLPAPQIVEDQPYPGIRYEDMQRERRRRRETSRRTRSRITLTPSNLIYPMRAPSNIAYNSPPPPYQATLTSPPAYQREQGDHQRVTGTDQISSRHTDRRTQNNSTNIQTIHEESPGR